MAWETAVAGVMLVGWTILRISTLWMPSLVTVLPEPVERSPVAVAGGLAAGATAAAVRARLIPG